MPVHADNRARPVDVIALIDQITSDARRNVASARTYMQALDIAAAARIAIAMLIRLEARYG